MSDYDLFYWSVPFRGQFVRAVLAYADKTWTESNDEAISELMEGPLEKMPVPFMGPPTLIDKKVRRCPDASNCSLFGRDVGSHACHPCPARHDNEDRQRRKRRD